MPSVEKLDLLKSLKSEYVAPKSPRVIATTPGKYLAVEGRTAPGSAEFGDLVGALYAVAYHLKFQRKLGPGPDYTVSKLECRYLQLPPERDQDGWHWQQLIRVPDFITTEERERSIAMLIEKKKPATVRKVDLVELHEGNCVQMLHVGPYDAEPRTFAQMQEFAIAEGWEVAGVHHEIYVSDPRRVEPANLKTILRLPVRRADE